MRLYESVTGCWMPLEWCDNRYRSGIWSAKVTNGMWGCWKDDLPAAIIRDCWASCGRCENQFVVAIIDYMATMTQDR